MASDWWLLPARLSKRWDLSNYKKGWLNQAVFHAGFLCYLCEQRGWRRLTTVNFLGNDRYFHSITCVKRPLYRMGCIQEFWRFNTDFESWWPSISLLASQKRLFMLPYHNWGLSGSLSKSRDIIKPSVFEHHTGFVIVSFITRWRVFRRKPDSSQCDWSEGYCWYF
jgi:hypothetical protein